MTEEQHSRFRLNSIIDFNIFAENFRLSMFPSRRVLKNSLVKNVSTQATQRLNDIFN